MGASSVENPDAFRWENPESADVVVLRGLGAGRWRVSARVMQASDHEGLAREVVADGETDVEMELDLRR